MKTDPRRLRRALPCLVGLLVATDLPAAGADDLAADCAADYPRLEALFKHFHANPELSMQESSTSERIAAELEAEGYEVTRGIANHGAAPHLGRDPVVLASQTVLALQTIVTRDISPLDPAIITVGSFHAGTAPNVIANTALLEITVRYNSEAIRDPLLKGIGRVAINTARAAGLPEDKLPEVRVAPHRSPVTANEPELARRVRAAMEANMPATSFTEFRQSDMGAEDFPYLVNASPPIPSVYFVVGGTAQADLDAGQWAGHHSPLFRIEPGASIKGGVEAMTVAALELLGRP